MARNSKKKNVIKIEEARLYNSRPSKITLVPKNLAQETYINYLNDESKKVVMAVGPAGTGKTYLAVLKAIQELKMGNVDRIILARPAVSVDEKHGFLPGDITQKMDPWLAAMTDTIKEYFSPQDIKHMIEEGIIEIAPLAYMRGRNFKRSIMILDEAQLTTPNQLKMVLTRIAEGSRIVVTGDLNQADQGKNGLHDFIQRVKDVGSDTIAVARFDKRHVERSDVVKAVLSIYGED